MERIKKLRVITESDKKNHLTIMTFSVTSYKIDEDGMVTCRINGKSKMDVRQIHKAYFKEKI